jgi:hypothetical protein
MLIQIYETTTLTTSFRKTHPVVKMSDSINNTLTEAQLVILKTYLERYRDSNKKERREVYKEAWVKIELGPPAVVKKKIQSVKRVNHCTITICNFPLYAHKTSLTGC